MLCSVKQAGIVQGVVSTKYGRVHQAFFVKQLSTAILCYIKALSEAHTNQFRLASIYIVNHVLS